LAGAFPLSYSLDSIGPLARTVQDCADADAIMAGEETRRLTPRPVAGLRIGLPQGRLLSDLEPMVAAAFDAGLRCLERAGARIIGHDIEDLLSAMAAATAPASIASIEAAAIHAEWLGSKAALFDPRVHRRIALSGQVSAPVYIRMMRRRAELAAAMDERLQPVDVLALPTTAITALRIDELLTDDDRYTRANLLVLRNPMIANQFDLTSISLPIRGYVLPVGLMLFARHGRDRDLLDIAAGIEGELARMHEGT
jgi:aspartyl-tRNA(Asn)/glutamyl-tRNA(Gln) amidotransferase subunit A